MSIDRDDLIGKRLGQYTIIEQIGRGGMAAVYSARQESMNRLVAVKVLPRHFLHDPGFLDRFKREVDVISRLEHPHIVPIFDFGEADGVPFVAMRYLGGGSMAQRIHTGQLALSELIQPLQQVAQALDYAHAQGVIHRDLKPANIMLDESGNAYLSDFGIARVMGSDLTGSAIIGTPAYMSPEQAHGLQIDARSDIYSLGIVLFELITGHEPYRAETPMGLLLMHINEDLPAMRDFRDDVPESVEAVVQRATDKKPDARYASASALAHAYAEALMPQSAVTPPPTAPAKASTVQTRVNVPAEGPPSEPTRKDTLIPSAAGGSPNRAWLLLLVFTLVAIVVGGLLLTRPFAAGGPSLEAIPTPFTRAQTISTERYTLSIPQRWLPQFSEFVDTSSEDVLTHEWYPDDRSAFVSLTLYAAGDMPDAFEEDSNDILRLIDEDTAPDGTMRHSFRRTALEDWESGQLDRFTIPRGDTVAVLRFFTADSIADDPALVDTLQRILDSLRIQPA